MIELTDTTTADIARAILTSRRERGATTQGRVLTLIVATDTASCDEARAATELAAREHPSRVLLVTRTPEAPAAGLDATLHIGDGSGHEVVQLDLRGAQADNPTPVLLALLVPDAPVVTWWPGDFPDNPSQDPLGVLATRRVTDCAAAAEPMAALHHRASGATVGDTDLAWTRLTLWRALLAAALDQYRSPIRSGRIAADHGNASSVLLATWLAQRLQVTVEPVDSQGPGITEVSLDTADGTIRISRADARHARYEIPGQPTRRVALPRRSIDALLTEELRRLDHDEVFADTLTTIATGATHDH